MVDMTLYPSTIALMFVASNCSEQATSVNLNSNKNYIISTSYRLSLWCLMPIDIFPVMRTCISTDWPSWSIYTSSRITHRVSFLCLNY